MAARLVLRQPTDANLYAPSLNEAFGMTTIRENLKCFYFFFICLREAALGVIQNQRPWPCHMKLTVHHWDFHLVGHCAAAGRIMSPRRPSPIRPSHTRAFYVLPIFLPVSAFASSICSNPTSSHIFYGINSRIVNV